MNDQDKPDPVNLAYLNSHIEKLYPVPQQVLRGLLTLGYRLIRTETTDAQDGDDPVSWIVIRKGGRATVVQQKDINSTWMLHVTVEDIQEVEKYAIKEMWGVVELYRSLENE